MGNVSSVVARSKNRSIAAKKVLGSSRKLRIKSARVSQNASVGRIQRIQRRMYPPTRKLSPIKEENEEE